jgi:hypothetical protein
MFANDAGITDLVVADRQFVVGEPDGSRFVRELRVFQGAGMKSDRSRLFATRKRDSAVKTPESGQASVGNPILQRIWWSPQCGCGLNQVVLEQPGLGQRRPYEELVFPIERLRPKEWVKEGRRLRTASALERDGSSG